jgi:hypothetical protein
MHFEHVEHAVDQAALQIPPADPNDWRPLEALLGPALLGQFMGMGTGTTPDGQTVQLFKHGMSRRYLNVSADLRTWQYVQTDALNFAGIYEPMPLGLALAHVFHDAESLGATPTVTYDADFRAKRDAALAAAGYRTVTARPGVGVS